MTTRLDIARQLARGARNATELAAALTEAQIAVVGDFADVRRLVIAGLRARFTADLLEGDPSDLWTQRQVVQYIDRVLDEEAAA